MYKRILIPVLFDEENDTQASYDAAQALGDDDTTYTILHVLEDIPGYASAQIPSDVIDATKHDVEAALAKSAKGLPSATTQLVSGHAGRSIVDYAKANGIDCIVMASHRPGFEDIFLGSTAARVVRHAQCAVHVTR